MLRVTVNQLNQIKDIISNHMEALMLITVGDGKPSPQLVKKLGLSKAVSDLITDSYKYGKLSKKINKDLSKLSKNEVEELLSNIKLSDTQIHAVEHIKWKAQQSIDMLQQRIVSTVIAAALQSDLDMWEAVKTTIPGAIKDYTPRYRVIQELREKTSDWHRDWHRVAHTEMWSAKSYGEAHAIMAGESPLSVGGTDVEVYIRVSGDACNKCKQLYLEKDGVTPKVFKLSELMKNGNNYGRKQGDWLPVIPPLHPSCMCVMNVKPDNTSFDKTGKLVPSSTILP